MPLPERRKIMISKTVFRCVGIFFACCIFGAIGCSSMGFQKPDFRELLPSGPVDKAMALWSPAVQTGDQPQRGFGGRVYFYDSEAKKPIKVDGAIAVYAFDETNRAQNDNEPTRIYTFSKEDVKKSYAKSKKFGHSYNLWIPWDTDGPEGDAKKVSFIVRYVPDKGSSVISQQTTAYLSGRNNLPDEMLAKNEKNNNSSIQQTTADNSEKFIDKMRQPQQELPTTEPEKLLKLPENNMEHLIEINKNRPQKMQTTTIDIKNNATPNYNY